MTTSTVSSTVTPVSSRNSSVLNTTDDTSDPLAAIAKEKDTAATLSWAKSQYLRCKSQRAPTERQWYVNLAFYFGKQNIQLTVSRATTNGFQLNTPAAPPWRVRMVINRMRPAINKQVSNLTSQEPRFFTVASGTDDVDIASTRITEALLDNYYREQHYKLRLKRVVWWGSICGSSYFKTYWDPSAKDADGNTGDVVTDVIDPFHIYIPDLLQEDLENQPYVIHATTMSPDMVKSIYKTEVDANVSAAASILEDQFLSLTGISKAKRSNEVLMLEFWVKPNRYARFPKGAMFTVAGDKLVQFKEGWPYDHGEYPFAKFDDIDSGKFYGEALLTDLLPIQRELNRTRSQIIEAKNLMAKPKLLAERGSINAAQITSEPGQVVLYMPGMAPPTPLPMQSLPRESADEIVRLQDDISDIAGQHDIARLISGRTSAAAISAVQEQDATMIAGAATSIEQLTEKTGRQVIALVKQYYTTARDIKIVGPDQAFEILSFKNTDITNNTEIYVETGSALPFNKAGRQAFLMDAFKMGLIPDPNDVLELMQIGGFEKVQADILTDQRQAQRENMQMVALGKNPPAANFDIDADVDPMQTLEEIVTEASNPNATDPNSLNAPQQLSLPGLPGAEPQAPVGLPQQPGQLGQSPVPNAMPAPVSPGPVLDPSIPDFPVNEWDNHQVHIQIHNRFRKSQQFLALPDVTKKIFQQHVSFHNAAVTNPAGATGVPTAQGQPQQPNQPEPTGSLPIAPQQSLGVGATLL